jgi:hypothetical protein
MTPQKSRQDNLKPEMKILSRKRSGIKKGLEAANGFLKLVLSLRGIKKFFPKGIYRFKTFQEADAWSLKMMQRR